MAQRPKVEIVLPWDTRHEGFGSGNIRMDVVGRFCGGGYSVLAAGAFSRCWRWLIMRPRPDGLALAPSKVEECVLGPGWASWGDRAPGNYMGTVLRLQFQQEPKGGWPKREKGLFSASPFEELPARNYLVSVHIFGSFFYIFCG